MIVIGIQGLITKLRLCHLIAIGTITRVNHPSAIEDIFTTYYINAEVAVLAIEGVICEIAVHIIFSKKCYTRHRVSQFFELFKEGFLKVVFSSKVQRIPLVTPEAVVAVDGKWHIC